MTYDIPVPSRGKPSLRCTNLCDSPSYDKTAQLWDLQGRETAKFQGHEDSVFSAVFSPDGQRILTTSVDKTARLWLVTASLLSPQIIQAFQSAKCIHPSVKWICPPT